MKRFRKRIDSLLGKLSFLQKFVLLFLCGIVIPMVVQNGVYYWQTEKNIQEDMLDKINEALSDKAVKISGALTDALSITRNHYSNELLYQIGRAHV